MNQSYRPRVPHPDLQPEAARGQPHAGLGNAARAARLPCVPFEERALPRFSLLPETPAPKGRGRPVDEECEALPQISLPAPSLDDRGRPDGDAGDPSQDVEQLPQSTIPPPI